MTSHDKAWYVVISLLFDSPLYFMSLLPYSKPPQLLHVVHFGYQNSTNPYAYMTAFFTHDLQHWCSIKTQNM